MEPVKSYLTMNGWKRDWEKTKSHFKAFGRMLYDAHSGNQEYQLIIGRDRIVHIRPDRIVDYRFDLGGVFVLVPESRPSIRPDLAYPHIYATSPSQPLETGIKETSINDLYKQRI